MLKRKLNISVSKCKNLWVSHVILFPFFLVCPCLGILYIIRLFYFLLLNLIVQWWVIDYLCPNHLLLLTSPQTFYYLIFSGVGKTCIKCGWLCCEVAVILVLTRTCWEVRAESVDNVFFHYRFNLWMRLFREGNLSWVIPAGYSSLFCRGHE